jgi:hypothetical protein
VPTAFWAASPAKFARGGCGAGHALPTTRHAMTTPRHREYSRQPSILFDSSVHSFDPKELEELMNKVPE